MQVFEMGFLQRIEEVMFFWQST